MFTTCFKCQISVVPATTSGHSYPYCDECKYKAREKVENLLKKYYNNPDNYDTHLLVEATQEYFKLIGKPSCHVMFKQEL